VNLAVEPTDAPYFIAQVDALAKVVIEKSAPQSLVVIKVKSWFGLRWLGFSELSFRSFQHGRSALPFRLFCPRALPLRDDPSPRDMQRLPRTGRFTSE
jgi:hypothetical protein